MHDTIILGIDRGGRECSGLTAIIRDLAGRARVVEARVFPPRTPVEAMVDKVIGVLWARAERQVEERALLRVGRKSQRRAIRARRRQEGYREPVTLPARFVRIEDMYKPYTGDARCDAQQGRSGGGSNPVPLDEHWDMSPP